MDLYSGLPAAHFASPMATSAVETAVTSNTENCLGESVAAKFIWLKSLVPNKFGNTNESCKNLKKK